MEQNDTSILLDFDIDQQELFNMRKKLGEFNKKYIYVALVKLHHMIDFEICKQKFLEILRMVKIMYECHNNNGSTQLTYIISMINTIDYITNYENLLAKFDNTNKYDHVDFYHGYPLLIFIKLCFFDINNKLFYCGSDRDLPEITDDIKKYDYYLNWNNPKYSMIYNTTPTEKIQIYKKINDVLNPPPC